MSATSAVGPYFAHSLIPHSLPSISLSSCIIPNYPTSPENESKQRNFEQLSFKIFLEVLSLIAHSVSFEEILKEVGLKRQAIAIELKDSDWQRFGVLRSAHISNKISTDLIDKYATMATALEEIEENDSSMHWEIYSKFNGVQLGHRLGTASNKECIPLSKYIFSKHGKSTIAHTYPEHLSKVKVECTFLFNEIVRLDPRSQSENIQRLIAKLHWWLAQGCLYLRGSAHCAEITIAALTFFKFQKLTPYLPNIIPDQIALVMDEEHFVQIYPSFRVSL